ncbi:MAG: ABC transporter ATP-binding protein [Ardenticatenales bacterium]|nr:ABC transporter ATP-binding protein [Ardenticatenales bacterium]
MLSLSTVQAIYSGVVLALEEVTMSVAPGQMVALLGANGAGKSSTLKAISGLLAAEGGRITKGRIEFEGALLNGSPPDAVVQRGIVHVMEGRLLFRHLSVEDNLLLGHLGYRGKADLKASLAKVFHYFPPLEALRQNTAGFLSGGEQQMLVMGRGLMGHPKLMLLDEPSLGLAPMLIQDLFRIIGQLCREEGLSILVVEQNARVALNTVDYGYVMEGGRIVLEGSAEQLREDPTIQNVYLGIHVDKEQRSYRSLKEEVKQRYQPLKEPGRPP